MKNSQSTDNIEDIYPMSDIQKGMVYHSLKDPGSFIYNNRMILSLDDREFNERLFNHALDLMVEKHAIFRTGFNMYDYEEPVQIVYKKVNANVDYYNLSHLEKFQQEDYLHRFLTGDRKKAFNINSAEILWRMAAFKIKIHRTIIVWSFHHAIIDGWSSACFLTEFHNTYLQLKKEPGFIPVKLKCTYKTYILEQLLAKKNEDIFNYWRIELDGYRRFQFPGTFKTALTGNKDDQNRKKYSRDMGIALLDRLKDKAKIYNTSVKHICFSAYVFMLSMFSFENDILVGLVVHNRPVCEDGGEIIGCFLNTIPVRIKIPDSLNWKVYIDIMEMKMKEIKRYEKLSLFEISRIAGERTGEENPLFDVMFNFVDFYAYRDLIQYEIPLDKNDGLELDKSEATNILFDFSLDITNGNLLLTILYSPLFVNEVQLEKVNYYFERILNKIIETPGDFIRKEKLMPEEEKTELLYRFNATGAVFLEEKFLHELFDAQALKTPDSTAIVGKGETTQFIMSITYGELNHRSWKFSYLLKEKGILPNTIVGIMTEQSLEMIIIILSILKAGGAYLPIDPEYPQERIDYMLKDSKAKLIINYEFLKEAPQALFHHSSFIIQHSNHPCYIIYTSGSMGKPKGVMVGHRNATAYLQAFSREFTINPRDIVVQQASYSFDTFVEEVYPILIKGGQLAIAGRKIVRDIDAFIVFIEKKQVNIISCSPQLLNELNQRISQTHIRLFISGGDVLKAEYIQQLLKFKDVDVYNTYGPTESTVCATYYRCSVKDKTNVLIGKPIANYRIYILDTYGQLLPIGVIGELCVSGDGLALGYLNNISLTAEKFTGNPFEPGCRMYRTGDLARWLPDGNIEFSGRSDVQIKIRGFRIEIGEIENRLAAYQKIKDAAVVCREAQDGDKYLCAFVVYNYPFSIDPAELRDYLTGFLPGYMIPSVWIPLEKIPNTLNGKIDRKALIELDFKHEISKHYMPPQNSIEEKLAAIWAKVLNMNPEEAIGIDDDFFALGGHSLKASLLISKIHKEFDVKIPIAEIFKIHTLKTMAEYIAGKEKDSYRFQDIPPVEEKEYYPVSSAQKRMFLLNRIKGIHTTSDTIPAVLVVEGKLDREYLQDVVKQLIYRHESLRTSFEIRDEQIMQRVHRDVDFQIHLMEAKEEEIDELVKTSIQPFDLSNAPLLRVELFRFSQEKHLLIYNLHHIITDGTSMGILIRDFIRLYKRLKLQTLPIQYRDFAIWQNHQFQLQFIKKQEEYWLGVFPNKETIPVLEMPTDFPRPPVQIFDGNYLDFKLSRELTILLRKVMAGSGATLYMVLLAIYNILLSKYSGQEDIVTGIPIQGRNHPDLENMIGFFVNTLAIRSFPASDKMFMDFLDEVKENSLKAYENQDFQFEELVARLGLQPDPGRQALFSTMFEHSNMNQPDEIGSPVQSMAQDTLKIADLCFKQYEFKNNIIQFDLLLHAFDAREIIEFRLLYSTNLFKKETVERFSRHLINITSEVVSNPYIKISDIQVFSQEEAGKIMALCSSETIDTLEIDLEF